MILLGFGRGKKKESLFSMMSAMLRMNAVRVHQFGGPEVLRLEPGIPVPPITETQVRF